MNAALLIIDVQKAIDDPSWGDRNNFDAEANIARLLSAWRASGRPIFHVRHMSQEANSSYRPGQPGNEFKDEVRPLTGETVIEKRTNIAFIGTNLAGTLRLAGINALVVTGVITNNSVEATARMAGNLGFATTVVSDATATFSRRDYNRKLWTAEDVHAMSLANLEGEYAEIATTQEILDRLEAPKESGD